MFRKDRASRWQSDGSAPLFASLCARDPQFGAGLGR
jgi:hypothetical protein